MSKAFARCNECRVIYDVTASGTVKGLGVVGAILFGIRLSNPIVALGLSAISLLWGNDIEQYIKARCPNCDVALKVIGETLG
jgi:hypothetical protein